MNNYDIFQGEQLKIADLIQRRRLQLLVHSCIYYEMDRNIISDKQWDEWARELVKLQKDNSTISEKVMWYDAFKDWDASTGAFLPLKDEWVIKKAKQLIYRGYKNSEISNKPAVTKKQVHDVDKKTGAIKLF